MNPKKLLLGIVALAILAAAYWAGMYRGTQSQVNSGQNLTATVLPEVKAGNTVAAEGVVLPVKSAGLSLPAGGIIAEVTVNTGDAVKEGQLLVRLTNDDLKAQLQQAQAGLERAQANLDKIKSGPRPQELAIREAELDQAKTGYEVAKAALERTQRLYDSGGASQQDLEQATSAFKQAEASMRQAQSQLDLMRSGELPATVAAAESEVASAAAGVKQLELTLEHTVLRAPFSGTVASVNLQRGEYVAPGTPLVQLADFSSWKVQTDDLTELNISQVKVGNRARITFDAVPDLELGGEVTEVATFGEKKQGDMTYTATIRPDSFDERLRWNMTATVKIESPVP